METAGSVVVSMMLEVKQKLDTMLLPFGARDKDEFLRNLEILDNLPITSDNLKATSVAHTVQVIINTIKEKEVEEAAKNLLTKWQDSKTKRIPRTPSRNMMRQVSKPQPLKNKRLEITNKTPGQRNSANYRNAGLDFLLKTITGEGVPNLTYPKGSLDPLALAKELESEIFKHSGKNADDYHYYCQSRARFLVDVKYHKLRTDFLLGVITCGQLAVMTPGELANEKLRAQTIRRKSVLSKRKAPSFEYFNTVTSTRAKYTEEPELKLDMEDGKTECCYDWDYDWIDDDIPHVPINLRADEIFDWNDQETRPAWEG